LELAPPPLAVTLEDGIAVMLRPVLPSDSAVAAAFIAGLSERSFYLRTFRQRGHVSDDEIMKLTRVDYGRDMALAAIDRATRESLGFCRYVREGGHSAEFALVVSDAAQRRGVGRQLLARLCAVAAGRGITRLHAFILRENAGMVGLARSLGFVIATCPGDPALVIAEKHL
jgi:acetyltransferase